MDWKAFFKPTVWTIISFIVLIVLTYMILTTTDAKIFPCKVQPVVPNPPEFRPANCGLAFSFGARKVFTPTGYFMLILTLGIIPYLIACAVNLLIKHVKQV